jgi:hypothetical protein
MHYAIARMKEQVRRQQLAEVKRATSNADKSMLVKARYFEHLLIILLRKKVGTRGQVPKWSFHHKGHGGHKER